MDSRARRIAWGMMTFILMATSALPVLATDTLGEDFVLEIQAEPTPAPVPQDVTYYLDGTQPRRAQSQTQPADRGDRWRSYPLTRR